MPERGLKPAERACIEAILRQVPWIWKWRMAEMLLFVEAVYHVMRTGIPWADLPEKFGNWETQRRRYRRWAERGIWERIFLAVSPDNDCPEALLADSTACKVHRCALGDPEAAIGKTRGGHNTKVHVGVEPDGTVRTVVLTAGNVSDCLVMKDTLGGLRPLRVIADKGYDTDRCRREVREAGAVPVIPYRENRRNKHPVQRRSYRKRHKVENFFAPFKDFTRVSLRRDKSDGSYWGFVMFAVAIINMRLGWTTVLGV